VPSSVREPGTAKGERTSHDMYWTIRWSPESGLSAEPAPCRNRTDTGSPRGVARNLLLPGAAPLSPHAQSPRREGMGWRFGAAVTGRGIRPLPVPAMYTGSEVSEDG